ncbi:uncharacterized protein TEOVI_000104400 [Trypanosoma equiperdum]|uniref:Uncharacterized protein n=1 Tax=Trypanosoma equiperdum TaxID=5694 RepID=A0A1G4IB66_TRYEQ|nr:hypothetical protein, conserved [Trypanosoma equiperdum]
MLSGAEELISDLFRRTSTTSNAVEFILSSNSAAYHDVMQRICNSNQPQLVEGILRTAQSLLPTELFQVFGKSVVPVLLLFAPAVLRRVGELLAAPKETPLSTCGEWDAFTSFITGTHCKLLASPECRATNVRSLPPPPVAARHTPSWSKVFHGEENVSEGVPPPQPSTDCEVNVTAIGTDNYGSLLCTIVCGLSHLLACVATPPCVIGGPGLTTLCNEVMRLLSSTPVFCYASKDANLQIACVSLLLSVLNLGKAVQGCVASSFMPTMRRWFDLTLYSANAVCIQLLFPYILHARAHR